MKKFFPFIFLTLFSIICYSLPQKKIYNLIDMNIDWFNKNQKIIEEKIINGNSVEIVPIVNSLGAIWTYKDGSIGSEVAPVIALAFIEQPYEMFLWFAKNPAEFDEWIKDLPDFLLTDYNGSSSSEILETKRLLLESLTKCKKDERFNDLSSMIDAFFYKLKNTEIKKID